MQFAKDSNPLHLHACFVFASMVIVPALPGKTFPCSSAVEQSTVNRLAVGSNPTGGANQKTPVLYGCFLILT